MISIKNLDNRLKTLDEISRQVEWDIYRELEDFSGENSFCFNINNGQIYYVYEDDSDDDGNVPREYLAPDFLTFIDNMVE